MSKRLATPVPCGACGTPKQKPQGPLCGSCWKRLAPELHPAYALAATLEDAQGLADVERYVTHMARLALRRALLQKLWKATWKAKFKAKFKNRRRSVAAMDHLATQMEVPVGFDPEGVDDLPGHEEAPHEVDDPTTGVDEALARKPVRDFFPDEATLIAG